MNQRRVIETIQQLFCDRGGENYADEAVTQRQHAVQCAQLARREFASHALVTAALLHDIGHLLAGDDLPRTLEQDLDDQHELRGYRFLKEHFGPEVAEPVRLHVAAKRYLCTLDPAYAATLSPTSRKSFYDQGGEMNPQELDCFRREPHFEAAVQLRRWDDSAKDPQASLACIEDFLPGLIGLLKPNDPLFEAE